MPATKLNSSTLRLFLSATMLAGGFALVAQGASAAERAPPMEEPPAVEMTPLPDVEPALDVKPEDAQAIDKLQIPPPPQTANHYTCYRVEAGRFQPRVVILRDQFGARKVQVIRITRLCTPTIKYVDHKIFKPSDPRMHLVCYEISKSERVNRAVLIDNQFGRNILKVYEPNELCLPSIKRLFR